GRRGRAAVAGLAEVVLALAGAAGLLAGVGHPLVQLVRGGGQVEEDPVRPGAARGVPGLADQRGRLRPLPPARPAQRRRDVLAGGSVLLGDRTPFMKRRAAHLNGHGRTSAVRDRDEKSARVATRGLLYARTRHRPLHGRKATAWRCLGSACRRPYAQP